MKSNLFSIIVIFCITVISCKKDNPSIILNSDNTIPLGHFQKYLNNLVGIQSSESQKDHLNNLKYLLLIKEGKQYNLNDSILIQIIPLKEAPAKFKKNSNDGLWFMVYRFNEDLKIHKPEIIQLKNNFIANTNQENVEAIFKLYNFSIPPVGTYTKYSIGGRYLIEFDYEQLRLKSYRAILPFKKSRSGSTENSDKNTLVQSDCIDWYLVTTIYYADGSSYQYEQYLSTTCSSSCSPSTTDYTEAVECDPDLGGGGSDPDGESEILNANPDWEVASSTLGYWMVRSYEIFTGERGPNYNKFLTVEHRTSEIFSQPSPIPGVPWARWKELSPLITKTNDWIVTCNIKGKISFSDGSDAAIEKLRFLDSAKYFTNLKI